MRTLIMVPLQEEISPFCHDCTARGLATVDATVGQLIARRVPDLGLTVVPGGLGKVQFAIQTQHVLDVNRTWDVVICAGAAGALVNGVAVGDVVVTDGITMTTQQLGHVLPCLSLLVGQQIENLEAWFLATVMFML